MPVQPIPSTVILNFSNNAPNDAFITMLYLADSPPDTTFTIHAVNINTTACFNTSVFDAVAELTQLSFTIGSTVVTTQVISKINKGSYWHFVITPFQVQNVVGIEQCNLTLFEPTIISSVFTNSDYNPLISNATFSRTSDFIYDVDRVKNQSQPTNLDAILDQSADAAPIQDSSYSSVGITNSRYNGTKTNINEYGFSAAINASMFEGAIYTEDKIPTRICSLSGSNERPIKDYLFSIDSQYNPVYTSRFMFENSLDTTPDEIDLPQPRYNLIYSGSVADDFQTGANPSTNIFIPGNRLEEIFPDRYYVIRMGATDYEVVVLSNPLYINNTNKTRYDVERKAFEDINGDTNQLSQTVSANTSTLPLYEILGDTIYNTDGSQVYKITEKLLYVGDSNNIYYIDSKGQAIAELIDCSI